MYQNDRLVVLINVWLKEKEMNIMQYMQVHWLAKEQKIVLNAETCLCVIGRRVLLLDLHSI